MQYKIGASLACADQLNLERDINLLISSGIDFLHVDIMDGLYVNNYCFGTQIFDYLKKFENIEIEVHLMVDNPYDKIDYFKDKYLDKISFHVEAAKNPIQTLSKIKSIGKECGIALNAATHENSIEYLYNFADYILIMAVEAGFAGQDFISSSIDKVKKIREELKKRRMEKDIYIDGHIDMNTISVLSSAGANAFVGGTAGLFTKDSSFKENIANLQKYINKTI